MKLENNKGISMSIKAIAVSTLLVVVGLIFLLKGLAGAPTRLPVHDLETLEPLVSTTNTSKVTTVKKVVRDVRINFKRTIYMYSQVNPKSMQLAVDKLNRMSSDGSGEPIWLLLSSNGGSILHGEMLLSAIQSSRVPVYTVNTFLCASMCAVIHQYGTKRYSFDRATLMFHDANGGFNGNFKEIQSVLDFINRKIEKSNRYIAARSGLGYDKFMNLHSHELWIDAEEAKSLGFVDDIILSQTDASVRPSVLDLIPSEDSIDTIKVRMDKK